MKKQIIWFLVLLCGTASSQIVINQSDFKTDTTINAFDAQGLKTGLWVDTIFHDARTLYLYRTYNAGFLNGVARTFYINGNLHSICYYENDTAIGIKRWFNYDGSLNSIALFENGEKLYYIMFDENGSIYAEYYRHVKYEYKYGKLVNPDYYPDTQ